jgi:hypothetical protein
MEFFALRINIFLWYSMNKPIRDGRNDSMTILITEKGEVEINDNNRHTHKKNQFRR